MPEHTYFNAGAYTVKLTVSDREDEANKEKIIRVVTVLDKESVQVSDAIVFSTSQDNSIVINEIMPNPEGSDSEGEFIELFNSGTNDINIISWTVDDSEGGSKPYAFKIDTWLRGGEYFLLERNESGLALNNTADAARLYNDLQEIIDEIEYEKVVEGESYARGQNGKWFWTSVITPGEENVISVSDSSEAIGAGNQEALTRGQTEKPEQLIDTTLEKIKDFDIGDQVRVKGVVAVLPGVLGAQYFYIVGSPGIQVYNYKKDFPGFKIGDYIEVTGEISESGGERRIKTKTKEDMQVLESGDSPIPSECTCETLNDERVGELVQISGEVVERKASIVYLDDGTDEMRVYLKSTTGINPKSVEEGDILSITGILSRTKSGLRLMPRSNDDIVRKDIESSEIIPQVLGEVAVSDEWEIAVRDKKLELFQYLLVLSGTAIVVLGGLLWKAKKE
jgi:PKD repeat protein